MNVLNGRRWRRAAAALAAGVLAAVLAGGCTSARNGLGHERQSLLPGAARGGRRRARAGNAPRGPAGRRRRPGALRRVFATCSRARAGAPVGTVCAFSYRGSYTQAEVERPFGTTPPGPGTVAIRRGHRVHARRTTCSATFVLDREPMPFRHNV